MGPRGVPGVFAGYSMKDGYRWGGHYLVWELRKFVGKDLRVDARYADFQYLTAHRVQAVEIPDDGLSFPLLEEYTRVNETLAGL
eukprot:2148661-Alexandrium_andersonii.AAC.1